MFKQLADASLEVESAEAALAEQAFHRAAEHLDAAAHLLDELRAGWPQLTAAERAVVGPEAAGVKQRMEAGRRRVPRLSALTVGTPESDPEEEQEPS